MAIEVDREIGKKNVPTSTVGRGKTLKLAGAPHFTNFANGLVNLSLGDSLSFYRNWEAPTAIVSDGAYGVLGFEGDTSDHMGLAEWYEPHVKAWSESATPNTTLWFWNSEIGWATVHPVLEKFGWRYVNCNIWNKGKGHIAGNVNTAKIRRFPVVTEVCVQYVFEAKLNGKILKEWLRDEWRRSGIPFKKANEACGVKDVATRKYFDQGHLWYIPPVEMFEKLVAYANQFGAPSGRPYFSADGAKSMSGREWEKMRSKFFCPHGFTNVWDRPALRGAERITEEGGKALHLNQKPLDLMEQVIKASTEMGDVVWEPFGGLFSASLASERLKRRAYAGEIDWTYFYFGTKRFSL